MALALSHRRNVIAAVLGRKGSGKSTLLHELFTARAPRVLSLDATGETVERNRDAVQVFGLAELLDFLEHAAEYRRWHVAASLPDEEIPALVALLAPRITSADTVGLSLALGGIALECGEADIFAPNGRTAPAVADAFKRGRHHCLSLFLGTQRPAACDRLMTSQADYIVCFAQTEPRDRDFVARAISAPVADVVARLPQYHCVWYQQGATFAAELDARRQVVRRVSLDGSNHPGV